MQLGRLWQIAVIHTSYSSIRHFKWATFSDSFTILGLWVLGLAVSNINESQLQTYESKTLFLMTSLQYYCIPGLAEIKTYAQKMQDAQVTKSLHLLFSPLIFCFLLFPGIFLPFWSQGQGPVTVEFVKKAFVPSKRTGHRFKWIKTISFRK